MSEAKTGKPCKRKGIPLTDEHKAKLKLGWEKRKANLATSARQIAA